MNRQGQESSISIVTGNLSGLKPAQLKRIHNLARRRVPPDLLVSPELAKSLLDLTFDTSRQIGVLLSRGGAVEAVAVGSDREITIPDLSDWRLGRKRLRGLRMVHTRLHDETLTQDDLTDLALLRLDAMAVLSARSTGAPPTCSWAHLLPPNPEGRVYEVSAPEPLARTPGDLRAFLASLDDQLAKSGGLYDVRDARERAILVSASSAPRGEQEDALAELRALARSAQLVVLDEVVQRLHAVNPRYLLGKGKLREVVIRALQYGADLLVFAQDLTPLQVKTIGELTEMRVIDRTQLILDIFARRAHSRDGRVQVELAQLKYRLPRLAERSTALSRLTGGIGGRGPGETRLEVDRRRTRDRIGHLERELEALSRARAQRRALRTSARVPIVSIVGYTNAGKSTLLNVLTKSDVLTEDLLFATLDTTTRRLRTPRERDVIITDTVGFIQALPRDLLGAFRPTLDELKDATLLLHVVDASHPRVDEHIKAVNAILDNLGVGHIPTLFAFNKIDQADPAAVQGLLARYGGVAISARDPATLGPLLAEMDGVLAQAPGHEEVAQDLLPAASGAR
ncbi:MAG: GTPase HflX [Nitrospirota bacterium]